MAPRRSAGSEAAKAAEAEAKKAQSRVAERCCELGIPKQFAPACFLSWSHRGYGDDPAIDFSREAGEQKEPREGEAER